MPNGPTAADRSPARRDGRPGKAKWTRWSGSCLRHRVLARASKGPRSGGGGQVMVIFALSAVVLIALAGLAIDGGLSYMSRSSLQSGADTASNSGASMLGADYTAESRSTPSTPFSYAAITSQVGHIVDKNGAGPTQGNVYSAYFTAGSSQSLRAGITLCQFAGAPTAGVVSCTDNSGLVSILSSYGMTDCVGPLPTCAGVVVASGVRVVETDTHATSLESIVGINQASEVATATSVYSFPSSIGSAPYIVWNDCIYDTTTKSSNLGTIQIGDQVIYFEGDGLDKGTSCLPLGDSAFKGDIHPPMYPLPVNIPGWLQASPGVASSLQAVTIGSPLFLPLVDCIFPTNSKGSFASQCPGPYSSPDPGPYVACGASFSGTLGSGTDTMCIEGLVYIIAGNNCNVGPTTHVCWGTVTQYTGSAPGVVAVCGPTIPTDPSCGNVTGKNAQPIQIQLYQ